MLVVVVRFELHEGKYESFRPAILKNARGSRTEPGCHRFDVAFSEDGRRCFLYELYTDQAAFDVHHEMPHFKEFAAASGPLVKDKKVETYQLADA
jgi:quinol monooxygenase YgiN